MTRHFFLITIISCGALLLSACQQQDSPPEKPRAAIESGSVAPAKGPADQPPPTPPLREDFEGEPKLALFPRIAGFAPEEDDKEGQALWFTYLDHLLRTSGPVKGKSGKAFAIRAIKTVDSVGFFSPLAVTPDTAYTVTFRAWVNLPQGGVAGAGIIEFDEFLWLDAQYPKSLSEKHFQKAGKGVQLTGISQGAPQSFTFRTGPKTRMVHLVFFREGATAKEPYVIDDIEITAGPRG